MKKILFGLILLAICLASIGIVLAASTASDTNIVDANIGPAIEISAQNVGSSQNPWVLKSGNGITTTVTSIVTIKTNGKTWTLLAADTTPGTIHLGRLTSGTDFLATQLKIIGTSTISLTGIAQEIYAAGYLVTQPVLTFSQKVVTGDKPHSDYKMTITYTGTVVDF